MSAAEYTSTEYLTDAIRRRLRDGGVDEHTAALAAREILHDLSRPYRRTAIAEWAIAVGHLVDAEVYDIPGEVTVAYEGDGRAQREDARALYRIGGTS